MLIRSYVLLPVVAWDNIDLLFTRFPNDEVTLLVVNINDFCGIHQVYINLHIY